jgi:hypothetical protein
MSKRGKESTEKLIYLGGGPPVFGHGGAMVMCRVFWYITASLPFEFNIAVYREFLLLHD